MHPRNDSTNRYPLFKDIFTNIENSSVLDFGGSTGNLLHFSNGKILETSYTSVDVDIKAIQHGQKEFSNAKFIHYNRYNWMYNHAGEISFDFPDIDKNQDYIWAYSVFSHTDLDEFIYTVKWFTTFNFKKIAVSFLTFNEMLEWAYNKRVSEFGQSIDIKQYANTVDHNVMYFFDNNKVLFDTEKLNSFDSKYLLTFYNSNFLLSRFKKLMPEFKINIISPGNGYVPFLCIEK